MKKFISLLLTVMILITNISVSNVKAEAEKVYNYVLTQDPDKDGNITWTGFKTDKADKVLDKIQDISQGRVPEARPEREYTLTLNADLVIPLDDGRLKVLNLNRDFKQLTIEGKNHTISAVDYDGNDTFLITHERTPIKSGGLYLRNVTLDGAVNGVNKYNLIKAAYCSFKIDIENCTLKNAKRWALRCFDSSVDIRKTEVSNCGSGNEKYFEVQAGKHRIEKSKFIGNHGSVSIYEYLEAELINTDFIDNDKCDAPLKVSLGLKLTVEGGTIRGNKATNTGGIADSNIKSVVYKGISIENNEADYVGAISIGSKDFTISNCNIKGNKGSHSNAAINISGSNYERFKGKIENSVISDNTSDTRGAIAVESGCDLDINNTVISSNVGKQQGGAIYASLNSQPNTGDIKIKISGSKITNNSTDGFGGAIYTNDYSYEFTGAEENPPYKSLEISNDVVFEGNKAGLGFFNPPDKYNNFKKLGFRKCSLEGKLLHKNAKGEWEHVRSLINNYDISYINKTSTVAYDPNGGFGKLQVEELDTILDSNEPNLPAPAPRKYTRTIKSNKETKFSNGDKYFTSWNTEANGKGTTYMPGDLATIRGNLYLYAQWYDPGVTLTLNENYRGGKITEKNVFRGDSFDEHLYKPKRRGHTFKGWSYKKKHLDKVHRDDIIEEPITVYAIWDEVEEEEEIKALKHKAYIFGYPDGTVRPNGEITRAEAAAMLARLLEIESIGSAEAPNFPDTPSDWYNKAINAVVQRDIMKGYPDGTFKPNNPITRAEFTQMIWAIDNKPYGTAPFADVVGHWAERPIGSEYEARRIAGYPDGTFRPDNSITRCEAAVILNKIFERNFDAMSLMKCKNPMMIKYFTDLDMNFWGYYDMVEATNTHEYIRRTKGRVAEDWLQIK